MLFADFVLLCLCSWLLLVDSYIAFLLSPTWLSFLILLLPLVVCFQLVYWSRVHWRVVSVFWLRPSVRRRCLPALYSISLSLSSLVSRSRIRLTLALLLPTSSLALLNHHLGKLTTERSCIHWSNSDVPNKKKFPGDTARRSQSRISRHFDMIPYD